MKKMFQPLLGLLPLTISFIVSIQLLHAEDLAIIKPSRAPEKGCTWKKLQSENPKLSLLVQECDYGFRKINFTIEGSAVLEKYSDAPADSPGDKIIEIFDKQSDDKPATTLTNQFISKLSEYEKQHCIPQINKSFDYKEKSFQDPHKQAWVIAPDKAYATKIKKETPEGDMPEDSCGEYGLPVDSRAYFEFHTEDKSKFAYVILGQDVPLFDEQSLDF